MMKFNILARILVSFGLVLLALLSVGLFAHSRLTVIADHALALKGDAVMGMYEGSLIREALSTDYMETFDGARGVRASDAAHLAQLVDDYDKTIFTDGDRQAFSRFKADLALYQSVRAQPQPDPSRLKESFKVAFSDMGTVIGLNQQRALAKVGEIDALIGELSWSMTVSFVIALAVALVAGWLLMRSIIVPLRQLMAAMDVMRQGDFTRRVAIVRHDELGELGDGFNRMADEVVELVGQVQRSGIRVSTSMTEIAATSKQQQATAAEVAATTTQIGATSREIAVTSKELVRTMTDVAAVSDNAAMLATGGQAGLAHMGDTMSHVMEAANSINAKLGILNEKAGDINQVVTTITKVAGQTNLLSLNAAIEAEKAGEYGRGFAVVSSEIRRLADQTAVATYDIEQMVKEIQSAVAASVMGMDKFAEEVRRGLSDVHEIGNKFAEIITQVQALAPRVETVTEGMQAQATGAEQISEALVQLTEATQQTVESLRQSSAAIDELNHVSGSLHGSITRFRLVAA